MIRKFFAAAAVGLVAFFGTAHADCARSTASEPAPERAAASAVATEATHCQRRAQQAPTAIRVALPATAEIVPDRFRAIVMFGGSGTNRAELEKNADTALAKVQKALAGIPGVKATPGMRQHRDMRCSSNGVCVAIASMPTFHSELELTSDTRQALAKALAEAQKATDKASMSATPIQAGVSNEATQKAMRAAMIDGRRAVEAAAASLTKDGERWHIAEIRFDQNCTAAAPMPLPMPPSAAEMPAFVPPAEGACNTSPTIEMRANATILIFAPPKP